MAGLRFPTGDGRRYRTRAITCPTSFCIAANHEICFRRHCFGPTFSTRHSAPNSVPFVNFAVAHGRCRIGLRNHYSSLVRRSVAAWGRHHIYPAWVPIHFCRRPRTNLHRRYQSSASSRGHAKPFIPCGGRNCRWHPDCPSSATIEGAAWNDQRQSNAR